MRILVVEDDPVLMNGLQVGLGLHGFMADAAATLEEARAALRTGVFSAVVLDWMLPDGSGLDLLPDIRACEPAPSVILLTARDTVSDRIEGLDAGADDYLGKPFDLDELAARVRAIARRSTGRSSPHLTWNDLVLDPAQRCVSKDGVDVPVSRREFAVLHALMERPGAVLSRVQIEDRLYGWDTEVESNAVEVHIHRLRAKLGRSVVETLRGVGYRLGTRGR
uniref:response regulator n=1 Tax=uncultured Caulobacter sp. TaxID=158749 RepID=UPI0025F59EE5|nr:response regulator transcription factor [uncultured Caulobacter sp.]